MTAPFTRRDALLGALSLAAMPCGSVAATSAATRFPVRLRDMMVLDARSRTRFMLLRDLVRDRVAVINFMFTGCSTICPVQSTLLSRAQPLLADAMGRSVIFASVSISPLSDTPEALVRFANRHGAGAGWHFLRAGIADTQRFQEGFDSFAPRVEDHPPVIAIGQASTTSWARLYGSPKPKDIAAEVRRWLRTG